MFDSIDSLAPNAARRALFRAVLVCGLGLGLTAESLEAATVWVPLTTGAPPGMEATVVLDAAASSGTNTWIEVRIHGYWQTSIVGPDSLTYQKIEVPGLGRIGQTGAPDVPAVRARIATATGAALLDLVLVDVFASTTKTGIRVYPFPQEGLDDPPDPTNDPGPGDSDGTPETFVLDPAVYALPLWPAVQGEDLIPIQPWCGKVRSANATVYPIRVKSPLLQIDIATHMRCLYVHPGTPVVQPKITKDLWSMCEAVVLNWPEMDPWFEADTTQYKGRYLFLAKSTLMSALEPLVEHRKNCGFAVTKISLAGTFSCQGLRNVIQDWYDDGLPGYDHYCLLVGDTDSIPLCPSPTTDVVYSDDAYGSPLGIADLDEEIFVGRLSVDSAADLTQQIVKILDYELHPKQKGHYERAVLVAHKEEAPLKYVASCETVAADSYAVPPTFVKRYGSNVGTDNSDVIASLNDGCGILCYRGHGSTNTWASWNLLGESFHKNDVVSLSLQPFEPIVWAITCANQNIEHQNGSTVDSIGENWLEHYNAGGVAHYGSTTVSGTQQNNVLQHEMFRAVFDHGLTVHAQAMAAAEHQMVCLVPGLNSWMYLLLGDPAMIVRRKAPKPIVMTGPKDITASPTSQPVVFFVKDEQGIPIAGALVSLHKPKWPPVPTGDPEILATGYTGPNGNVTINLGPTSFGTINTIGRDPDGNVATGTIKVDTGPWTDLGGGKFGGGAGKPTLGGTGTLKAGTPNSIDLYQAPINRAAILFVATSANATPFYGGTLHPLPVAFLLNTVTDDKGRVLLPIASWPAGIPSDANLVFQYAIDDPAAAFGVGLSNGLLGVTP